jgi:uncharacterized membrane protein
VNRYQLILGVVMLFTLCNCTNEMEGDKVVFQHATLRPWFDNNCARCHSKGKNNYLHWLYNPNDFETSFSTHYANQIYKLVNEGRMPNDAILTDEEKQTLKTWYEKGRPSR